MSRTTGNGPSGNQPDDGDCVVCGDPADGIDAPTRQPICRRCASIRCDGGQEIRPGRRRVTSSITFGGASSNYVSTPGDDVNHLSGEVSIEVSGASSDYPHPTRLQREIEAAVADVLDDYTDRVSDDVDRGDGVETDGGLLTGGGRYHVVCSDCTLEDLKRERHQAARAVDDHRTDEPSHSVRFEEVRGR
ncbi:hypothetical protein [Haloplanus pelagicus]|uniref:hypothetical protein n=1 Tax=Haloplanus pelagicus TaxID=2949995 RepID=UPI002041A01F|nr:hypothetical protein [Haloplanus sp. HW8-1]